MMMSSYSDVTPAKFVEHEVPTIHKPTENDYMLRRLSFPPAGAGSGG